MHSTPLPTESGFVRPTTEPPQTGPWTPFPTEPPQSAINTCIPSGTRCDNCLSRFFPDLKNECPRYIPSISEGIRSPDCCAISTLGCLVRGYTLVYNWWGAWGSLEFTKEPSQYFCDFLPDGSLCGQDRQNDVPGCNSGIWQYRYANSQYDSGYWSGEKIGLKRHKLCGPSSFGTSLKDFKDYGGYAIREPVRIINDGVMSAGRHWYCKANGCWPSGTWCGQHTLAADPLAEDLGCYADRRNGDEWGGCCSGKIELAETGWRFDWYKCK